MTLSTDRENPLGADLDLLFRRHAAEMQADTPPGSIHTLPKEALADADVAFFVVRNAGQPVAMAALKDLGGAQAELKSMHVLAEHRGRGISRMLLRCLIAQAREAGLQQVSLETGAQPSFLAARTLYTRDGFTECPPFGSYRVDPHSVFMTLTL